MSYHVDLVLCIDCTHSMTGLLSDVKEVALNFHSDLETIMKKKRKVLSELRVRVIGFRDFYDHEAPPLEVSEFFRLPEQNTQFFEFIDGLEAVGGGDLPENALEALSLAIRSKWEFGGKKRRHVITLWTDDAAHDLEESSYRALAHPYPKGEVAGSFVELSSWWRNRSRIDQNGRRLVLFAPPLRPWEEIFQTWDEVMYYPSIAGEGLNDTKYSQIIANLAKSMAAG